jgi:hypothetical protein
MNKRAWIIPLNLSILFAILCGYAVASHDTIFAVIEIILCMVNGFFTYRWLKMGRRTSKS